MLTIRPFKAVRPEGTRVAQVASVPYDVVNREEAAQLAEGNPQSFLRISRAEIGMPAATDPYSAAVYEAARRNFDGLLAQGVLLRETEPALYLYKLTMGNHSQLGVAGTFSVDEYDRDLIKKHERTRQDKEDDRTRHIVTVGAQTGPVFLAYRDLAAMDQALRAEADHSAPLYDFTAVDGIRHQLWKARDPKAIVEGFQRIEALYIADGHHRAASASRARKEQPGGDADYFLAVAFPASQLRILPYHRLLKEMPTGSVAGLLAALRERGFTVKEGASPNPEAGGFSMYAEKKWYGLTAAHPPGAGASMTDRLDVAVLQARALEPLFGIRDPRTDHRIDFVGGIRGTSELERRVDSGSAKVAFALYPTTLEQLMAVSDQGGIMPPKSTWFEPKLRDGILSHLIRRS